MFNIKRYMHFCIKKAVILLLAMCSSMGASAALTGNMQYKFTGLQEVQAHCTLSLDKQKLSHTLELTDTDQQQADYSYEENAMNISCNQDVMINGVNWSNNTSVNDELKPNNLSLTINAIFEGKESNNLNLNSIGSTVSVINKRLKLENGVYKGKIYLSPKITYNMKGIKTPVNRYSANVNYIITYS